MSSVHWIHHFRIKNSELDKRTGKLIVHSREKKVSQAHVYAKTASSSVHALKPKTKPVLCDSLDLAAYGAAAG